jgi:ParB family chromosome partitioning protein
MPTTARFLRIEEIPLDLIDVAEANVRKILDEDGAETSLRNLGASIREHGLRQEVEVYETPAGRYELYIGQRRYLASKLIQASTIRCKVFPSGDPEDAVVDSMIENLLRADMHPMDKAKGFARMLRRFGDVAEVSRQCSVGVATIRKYLALLHLSPELQDHLQAGETRGTAALAALALRFPDEPERQTEIWSRIGGFRQDIQQAIIHRLGPNAGNLGDLIGQATDGEIGSYRVTNCPWDCPTLPPLLKAQIAEMAHIARPNHPARSAPAPPG